jgi:hypothetical protein
LQASKSADCMQQIIDKLTDVFPTYFGSSSNLLLNDTSLTSASKKFDETTIEFLSNTKIVIDPPSWRSFHQSLIRVQLVSPFLLNDLMTALQGDVSVVPSFFNSPIKISSTFLYDDGRIEPLSDTEQSLRAFPRTEWLWAITPLKSGDATGFVKFTIARQINGVSESVPLLYEMRMHVEPDHWKWAANFVAVSWQWLLGTLLIPFGIFGSSLFSVG